MKLKSKNSFLKRISCIALSLMLCLTSFTLTGFVPTLEAEAATSKEVLHYNFNSSISDSVNGGSLTVKGWTENPNTGEQRSDHYYHNDGGVYGAIQGLNGKNNWILTYKGYSYNSNNDGISCEIGLGTDVGNTDVLRVTRNGILYVANENKGTMSLNVGDNSNSYNSSKINTIIFDYYNGNLKVTVNGSVFGSYKVEKSVFSNVKSLYSGVNAALNIGNRYHFIDDIVATTVDDTCVTKADFETAFTNFENKISNTKLYTNIKPAYDAYVNARKVYDAFYYGNDVALTNISDALLELEAQTAKLTTEWQSPTGTAVPSFEGGSVTNTEAYFNLLYSNKINDRQNTEVNAGKYDKTYVYNRIGNNQTVMLYDGKNQPKMPVVFVTVMELYNYHVGTKYRYPYMAYPTSGSNTTDKFSDLYLEDKWYFKESYSNSNESSCWNFNNIFGHTNARVGNGPTSLQAGAEMSKYGSGWTELFPYTNVLVYNNQKVFQNDDTGAYSKKYKLWWVFGDEAAGKTSIDQLKISRCQVDDNSAIYVVNYKPLRDAIDNAKSNIPNKLVNVKQGGLSTYLGTLNTLMSYNPNSSFSNVSSVTDGINNFNNAMKTNMSKAANLTSNAITSDNSAYDTIRTEIVNYRTIQTNKSYDGYSLNDYTDASKTAYTNAYNNAVNHMATVDTEGYDKTTDNPKNLAEALINARIGLTLKSFTIKFKYANGDITDGTVYTIHTEGLFVNVPANSTTDYDDTYHYSYSWPTIEAVTADRTYEEIKTPIGHTLSDTPVSNYQTGNYDEKIRYTHSYNCSDCEYVNTIDCTFENQGITGDTATLTCSVCGGTYTLDLQAYNKAVADANTSINNTVAYTLDSRNALSSVLSEQDTALRSAKTQAAVDSCTETIISKNKLKTADSAGVLELNQYSITFNVVDELGNKTSEVSTATVDYGTHKTLVLPDEYKDYVVTSWKREINSTDSIVGASSRELQVIVKSKAVYSVHVKKTNQEVDNTNAVITLNNKSGNIADIGYVPMEPDGTATIAKVTVNTDAGTIKIGDTTLTAPKYSFYDLDGFEIDGNPVASGQTIILNSKMVIIPVYTPSRTVTITRANADIRINGKDEASVKVEWNKKIVTSTRDSSPVVWKTGFDYDGNGTIEDSEKNVVAYGPTYSFYANSNVTIFAEAIAAPTDPTASIGYFDYDSTLNKVTVVNNFFVPEGKKAVKAGVVLSTKTNDRETLINQTTGRFEGTEKDFSGTDTNKNQIRISVTRTANTSFTMHALAYVVVEDENGKKDTYFAPTVRSITYTATKA